MNQEAVELNKVLGKNVVSMLSSAGKKAFFPSKGIVAQAADAKGKGINATAGIAKEEDGSPMRLESIAEMVSLDPGKVFPYSSSFGDAELAKMWKEGLIYKNLSLRKKEISTPVVTAGLTHGLSVVNYLFVDPKDKIILPDLFWGNYKLIFSQSKLDTFPTFFRKGFNVRGLEKKLQGKPGKKVVLLNFPNNPTGYTPTQSEADEVVATLKKAAKKGNKLVVICDDAYFGLVYKRGILRESIFSRLANEHENIMAVKVDGATKEEYVWGLRVGFLTYGTKVPKEAPSSEEFYNALKHKTAGVVRGTVSNVSTLSQSLISGAFKSRNYHLEKISKRDVLKKRFDKVNVVLRSNPKYKTEFEALPFNSGYFMCLELKNKTSDEVRRSLLDNYDTGVIALGTDKLRIAFSAVPTRQIPKLFDNIYHACKDLK